MSFLKKDDPPLTVDINGVSHELLFVYKRMKYYLYVDGIETKIYNPSGFIAPMFGDIDDFSFELGGANVVIALRFGKKRIAVNGIYQDTGNIFAPVCPLPPWSLIFVALLLLPPLVFNGNTMDILSAVCFSYLCTHFIMKNPDIKATTVVRILYCSATTLVSWGFFYMFYIFER